MKHKIYWEQRMKDLEKSEDKIVAELKRIYKRAFNDLDALLADIYVEMAGDGGISSDNLYKANRYSALQAKISELAHKLGQTEEKILANWLKELYKEEFKEFAEFMGDSTFNNVNEDMVEAAVKTNWSGEHFSRRVWDNKSKLVSALDRVIIDGIALGVSRQKMNKMILKQFDVAHYWVDRIVRTESNFIYNRAHFDNYKQAGILKYEFLAEVDSRTSTKCKDHNRKVYYLAEAQVGLNYPPLHPNCRSTVIPVIER